MPYKDPVKAKEYAREFGKGRKRVRSPRYNAQMSIINARARRKKRLWIREYKASLGCTDCGNMDHRVLDFDHRDRSSKSFGISSMVERVGFATLMEEIQKCDIRCANCHRIKTWNENANGRQPTIARP